MKSVGVSENGLWLIENAKTGEIEEFTDNMLSNDTTVNIQGMLFLNCIWDGTTRSDIKILIYLSR